MNTFSSSTSTNTGCISISALASSLGFSIGITSSAIGLEICAVAAGIKKYKSIIKKKKFIKKKEASGLLRSLGIKTPFK